MSDRIFLSSPDITKAEERALVRALRSGWVAPLGPEVDALEIEMANFTARRYAVALSSGTAALHLALLGVGAEAGSVVLTSTMTFAATANAITYTGAEPVFIDSDETGNMDPELLRHAVRHQLELGSRIAAVLPVDLLGKVADYESIGETCDRYGIPLLSDAAESLGAVRNGRPAGSFGRVAAISFNGNKIMTTSGGGMLLTDDEAIAARSRYLATQARQPRDYYEHTDIGYNYRLSNLLAGLGRAQLHRLPEMIERRRRWRLAYRELFASVPGTQIFGGADGSSAVGSHDNFWLSSVLVDPSKAGWTADQLRLHLSRDNIEARPLWKPMHLQPVFRKSQCYANGLSERYFGRGISLPSGSALTNAEFDRVTTSIGNFMRSVPA